ncbi:MAG TPA: saccharopine dehydrogenase NADP-binding domain-containing protein [Mycobacteriales bacterium]|nr:saccharopine dehydrogenase NADP-binding domain-containing protein [Mycobacteriales bacterium]
MTEDKLDVVLYGATGFVGTLTAAYLLRAAPPDARIGLAGRSRQRLEELRQRLGGPAMSWPLIVADSADRGALDELARRTTAVATTVGPYSKYGLPLVAACAEAGTHYADLTGELLFMRRTIDEFDGPARQSGARIVHNAGFDSIPSDLGVMVLHDLVAADGAGDLEDTTFLVTALRGGVSGGTIDSMRTSLKEMAGDPERRRLTLDPYALSPQRDKEPDAESSSWGSEGDLRSVVYDRDLGQWLAPFVMAQVNTRVVRRSNALQDWAYGRRFRYREVMSGGAGPLGLARAGAITGGLAAMMGAMALPPTRAVLDRVLPKPGEGPSEKTRTRGHFRIEIHTRTTSGAHYVATVAAQGDPGYAATAVMFGESALALGLDGDRLPPRAGVLTPATGIGAPLVDRLRAQGFTFDVRRG